MHNIPNYHILLVKFIRPSNYKGARVKIISERFTESKTISSDYSASYTIEMAANYLQSKGFNIIGQGEGNVYSYLISDTFQSLK